MRRAATVLATVGFILLAFEPTHCSGIAQADVTKSEGTLLGSEVRCEELFTNNTGLVANDFHMYAYIQERNAAVLRGATVRCAGSFTAANLTLLRANGAPAPPPGMHGCRIDLSGGVVLPGDSIKLSITLWMSERNVQLTDSLFWTWNNNPLPGPALRRRHGWRFERPIALPVAGFRHVVCIENGDDTPALLSELKLLAAMSRVADIEHDIDWSAIPPVQNDSVPPQPPVIIPPHGRWCFPFVTATSFVGGHVYLSYVLEPVASSLAAGGITPRSYGDHPVDSLCTDPACAAYPLPPTGSCLHAGGCTSALYEYDCLLNLNGVWAPDHECEPLGVGIGNGSVPGRVALEQNGPNPFRRTTLLRITLPRASRAQLEVFDVSGQRVATLLRGFVEPGSRIVEWDGRDGQGRELPSGLYFCRLRSDAGEDAKKLVLARSR